MLPEAGKIFGDKTKEEELKGKGWALGNVGEEVHGRTDTSNVGSR